MNDKQFTAAKLAEIRDIAKRIKHVEDIAEDILEILKINTYGDSDKGVQLSMDDICNRIVKDASSKKEANND